VYVTQQLTLASVTTSDRTFASSDYNKVLKIHGLTSDGLLNSLLLAV
jgi:hypothetical protein